MITITDLTANLEDEVIELITEGVPTLSRQRVVSTNFWKSRMLVLYAAVPVVLWVTTSSLMISLVGFILFPLVYYLALHIRFASTDGCEFHELHRGKFCAYWLREPHLHRLWVAKDAGGRVVGTIAYNYVSEDAADLSRMSVKQECRRQGVGLMLLNHLEDYCRQRGHKTVGLGTLTVLTEAIAFYKRSGFKLAKLFPIMNPLFAEMCVMKLEKQL